MRVNGRERQDLNADYADYADCSGGITGALAPGLVPFFFGNGRSGCYGSLPSGCS